MEEEEKTFGKEFWIKLIRILVSATLALLAYFLFNEEKYGLAINLTLNLIAWAILAYDVLIEMFEDIIKEHEFFSEETLMILATVGAFALRAFGVNEFIEAVLVLLLFQVGEMLEDIVTDKSHDAIKAAIALRATSAHKKVGDSFVEIDPKEVKLGDSLLVKVGEVLPADGKIIEGSGALDCSSLTGESLPVLASIGEEVYAGTILKEGSLLIEVSKEYEDNTVSKIISLIEEGGESKSKVTRFVDRFAKVYTPIVMALALLVAILPPMFLGFSDGSVWANWVYRALNFLIISCPCAIVISVPLAYFAGSGLASKHGIVIKGASIFDALVDLGYLATDKTGTLTKGVFEVSAIHAIDISQEELLEYATAVESRSNHPLASALLRGIDAGVYASKVSDYSEVAGKGVKGVYQGHSILCGNASFLEESGIRTTEAKEVGSHLHVAVDGKYAGYLVLADELRKETKEMVERLHQDDVKIALLSGDKEANVQAVAKDLSLDVYEAELLPEEKTKRLEAILDEKEKKTVAYMGDGINDAASIRMADVGIAMGGIGSDLAIENADVVIMKDDPSKVVDARNIAKLVRGYAIFDIVFALLIKLAILVLAVSVPNYPMIVSSLADTGLTLLLVGITMSLLHRKVR